MEGTSPAGQLRPAEGGRLSQGKATCGHGISRMDERCASEGGAHLRSRTSLSLRKALLSGRGKAYPGGSRLSIPGVGRGEEGVSRGWEAPIRDTAEETYALGRGWPRDLGDLGS